MDDLLFNPETEAQGRILAAYADQLLRMAGKTGRGLSAYADFQRLYGE